MKSFNLYPDKQEEGEKELTILKAAEVLAKNNILACEIHIGGITVSLCENSWILPLIRKQRREVEKYMKGEPNSFE